MKYRHRFRVPASVKRVAEFHCHSASMAAITPPPIVVKVQRAPAVLADGDEMAFTMWLGPLPVHWLARIEAVSDTSFTDRQLSGPFGEWVHRHTFVAVDENTTDVVDEITLRLRHHPLWRPVGFGMRLGLPVLFAYRAWKTKRMLS
jgi:ligand-binding SRPBCC domain-containing protein